MVGRTLGHYRVLEKLGEGGMGEVYLAEDTTLKRQVALKVLPEVVATNRERLDRLQREAESLAALNHPNIVTIYSIEEDDGCRFLTMELVHGQSLATETPDGGLDLDRFFDLAIPMADALNEAHAQGIVHRDLKPSNVMIDERGKPKILDFGLAKIGRELPAGLAAEAPTEVMTEPGTVLGTYPYLSPEQAEGKEVDHRSDLFSLGILFYEMLTGERPFRGESPVSLISSILKDEPRSLFELRGDSPEALNQILCCCLEKQPDQRYQSADELQQELEDLREALVSGGPDSAVMAAKLPDFLSEELAEVPTLPVFVGRGDELAKLEGFLDMALAGNGKVGLVSGEAGTGKTALVRAFIARALNEHPDIAAVVGTCSAHTGSVDPYSAFRQVLGQLTGDLENRWRAGQLSREQATQIWRLVPTAARSIVGFGADLVETLIGGTALLRHAEAAAIRGAPWLVDLKSLVERKLALPPDVMLQQTAVFGQCTRLFQDLAAESPLLIVLEDLHWSDAGSLDLLSHLSRQLEGHPILVLGTFRPSEVAIGKDGERHPFAAISHELQRAFGDCEVHLHQETDEVFVHALIDAEPNRLDPEFRHRLYERTQGHALFTVELLRSMQEQGMLIVAEDGSWIEGPALSWNALPAQVEGVISERIGRLSNDLRDLLKVASVEGESFTAEVLARIQRADSRSTVKLLSEELERQHRLVTAEGLKRINSNRLSLYRFLHVLFQKYLYDELAEAERAYLHEDVGTALEELFREQEEEIAAQLARHFEEAQIVEKAIRYRAMAGQKAVRMTANLEAIGHYRRAIDLLATLPPSETRDETELELQVAINGPLIMTEGWASPGVGGATSRALELSSSLGVNPKVPPALWFVASHFAATGRMLEAVEQAERMLQIALDLGDAVQVAMGHWMAGLYRGIRGDHVAGRDHLEKTEAFYNAEQHSWLAHVYSLDPGVAAKVHLGWMLANLGYLDQGRAQCTDGIALARRLGHPHTLCFALNLVPITDLKRKDWQTLEAHAAEGLDLASDYGFPHLAAYGLAAKGLAMARRGRGEEGIALARRGVTTLRSTGSTMALPFLMQMLAIAQASAGQWQEALRSLDEMSRFARETGELVHLCLEPVHRGAVLAESGELVAAEECLQEGIEIARSHQVRLFELEGATSLARLWGSQGKQAEARRVLEPIYDWFTEGFDEVPLKEARELLDELA